MLWQQPRGWLKSRDFENEIMPKKTTFGTFGTFGSSPAPPRLEPRTFALLDPCLYRLHHQDFVIIES